MKYQIPYSSKKKNPNAGRTKYKVPGHIHDYLEIDKDITHENLDLISAYTHDYPSDKITCRYIIRCDIKDVVVMPELKNYSFTIERIVDKTIVYIGNPEPTWIYQYNTDVEIECSDCQKRFDWKNLEYEECGSDEYVGDSDTVCPKCGAWNCCDLEFEK